MRTLAHCSLAIAACLLSTLLAVPAVHAQEAIAADHEGVAAWLAEPVTVDGIPFDSRTEYYSSEYFRASGNRCGTLDRDLRQLLAGPAPTLRGVGSGADCGQFATDPDPGYDPGVTYEIPVVVHIIQNGACTQGNISDAMVQSQIDILNEDLLAILGTNGANGTNVEVHFQLAAIDPDGSPTTGITRTCNDTWFGDNGNYWDTLAWDPHRYLNIYTNDPGGGILGYVPCLPADAACAAAGGGPLVGANVDRVVVLWTAFGRNSPLPPFHLGRTATHEVGHYFGLEHTFSGGCSAGTPPGCYTSGDLICDTNPEQFPTNGCPASQSSCSTPDPFHNYMDYGTDICMEEFTNEQARRIRCTLEHWRPDLRAVPPIFADGFESGDTTSWSAAVP